MSANVFISFASQDKKVATTLCAALESRGFSCWISTRDIKPGENFQIAIVRAIRNAKMMLLVFTANSNASDEMSKELALASQQKLIVVPLRVEDVAPNEAFAYEFATRQWIDFFADWEAAINQLCVRLAQAMPPEDVAPAAPLVLEPPPQPVAPPEPVAEARPTPAIKAPVAEPAPPSLPSKVEPVVAAAPKPPEPKPPEPKPQVAPAVEPPEAKTPPTARAPDVKPAPTAAAKPDPAAKAPTSASAAAPVGKSPVGLFVGIGVVVVLIIGAVFAMPMLNGKKPAAQASVTPSPPASSAAPVATAPTSATSTPVATAVVSGAATDSGAPADLSAASAAAPRPRVRKHAPAHASATVDVPY